MHDLAPRWLTGHPPCVPPPTSTCRAQGLPPPPLSPNPGDEDQPRHGASSNPVALPAVPPAAEPQDSASAGAGDGDGGGGGGGGGAGWNELNLSPVRMSRQRGRREGGMPRSTSTTRAHRNGTTARTSMPRGYTNGNANGTRGNNSSSVANLVTTARDEMRGSLLAAERAGAAAVKAGSKRDSQVRRSSNASGRGVARMMRASSQQSLPSVRVRRVHQDGTARRPFAGEGGGGTNRGRHGAGAGTGTGAVRLGDSANQFGTTGGSGGGGGGGWDGGATGSSDVSVAAMSQRRVAHRRRHAHKQATGGEVEAIKMQMAVSRMAVSKTTRQLDKLAGYLQELAAAAAASGGGGGGGLRRASASRSVAK